MQVKATDHVQRLKQSQAIAVRVARKDLLYWTGELYPVVLVIYDASADQASWLHVQQVLEGGKVFALARSGATLTWQVPVDQVVDERAIRGIPATESERPQVEIENTPCGKKESHTAKSVA
jgi:hypothetical protein